MKRKISITIEDAIDDQIAEHLEDGTFRNKSHLIEVAIRRFVEEAKK